MFSTIALELGIPAVAAVAVVGGGLSYFYLPIIGKPIAYALGVMAVAAGIYGAGFSERGALDKSADLAAQVVQMQANAKEAQREASAAKNIASEANARQAAAEDEASSIREKVDAYAAELAKRKTPACSLGAHDVGRLRNLDGPHPTKAKPTAPAG